MKYNNTFNIKHTLFHLSLYGWDVDNHSDKPSLYPSRVDDPTRGKESCLPPYATRILQMHCASF